MSYTKIFSSLYVASLRLVIGCRNTRKRKQIFDSGGPPGHVTTWPLGKSFFVIHLNLHGLIEKIDFHLHDTTVNREIFSALHGSIVNIGIEPDLNF
jgi:hypothetical protein